MTPHSSPRPSASSTGRALTEASGGVTEANVAEIARTGVDLISIGALTHSAPALDLSLGDGSSLAVRNERQRDDRPDAHDEERNA